MRKPWGRGSAGRAMRSQRIGQGFESPRLHHHKQTASHLRCRLLMAAKPAGERTCAQHFTCACLFALFSCIQASDLSARGFGGGRSRRFRPRRRPSGTIGAQIYILRQTSVLMAKLPSSCPGDTPQSRCPSNFYVAVRGSELARDITSSNAILYLPILAATACTSSVRAGSAACGAGRFRPSPPPGTCQTSLPNAPHLHIPTLMVAGNIFHG